jgi:hypothetical protein
MKRNVKTSDLKDFLNYSKREKNSLSTENKFNFRSLNILWLPSEKTTNKSIKISEREKMFNWFGTRKVAHNPQINEIKILLINLTGERKRRKKRKKKFKFWVIRKDGESKIKSCCLIARDCLSLRV